MKWRIAPIFIIIILLISSFLVSAVSQSSQIDDSSESLKPRGPKVESFMGVWASGNASSGKQFGILSRIGIIKFDYVIFDRLRLFPIRWEMVDFLDVTVIIIGLNQEIPEGPFDFEREWVSAIVFK